MKAPIVGILLLIPFTTIAGPHHWQDATVVAITPHHGTHTTQYSIRSGNITYVLGTYMIGGCSPFLTLNGKTKISVEGRKAYVLNDDGKVCKLPIIKKIQEVAPT